MTTKHCDECSRFRYQYSLDRVFGGARCSLGHKVRFFKPKSNNYMDDDYGWKRKCGDFKMSKRVTIVDMKGIAI